MDGAVDGAAANCGLSGYNAQNTYTAADRRGAVSAPLWSAAIIVFCTLRPERPQFVAAPSTAPSHVDRVHKEVAP